IPVGTTWAGQSRERSIARQRRAVREPGRAHPPPRVGERPSVSWLVEPSQRRTTPPGARVVEELLA
ncbi:MAG: hypothetical protein ACK50P_10110, partial [Planctomycetaceae bacterium]